MKHIALLLGSSLILAGSLSANADNIMITTINTRNVTHQWMYQPAAILSTADGFLNNEYTLTVKPDEKYLISEPIRIAGYDNVNIDCRYYVGTKNNHPVMIEFLDTNGDTVYSGELDGTVNQSTMTIGSSIAGISCDEPIVRMKLKMSKAYTSSEYANINELQVYGQPTEWNKRKVIILPYENTDNGVRLNWVTVSDAESYEVTYSEDNTMNSSPVSVSVIPQVPSAASQSVDITGIESGVEYTYTITAHHSTESPIKSSKSTFASTTGTEGITAKTVTATIGIKPGQLVISSDKGTTASVYLTTGAKVKETIISNGINTISLPAGIYILAMPDYRKTVIIP